MSSENNGGKTGYYDLPLPDKEALTELLMIYVGELPSVRIYVKSIVESILELCPHTLNDLIEYKDMKPWQHEIFKATYALQERAEKNGGSVLREIHKIDYYAGRGRKLAINSLEQITSKPVTIEPAHDTATIKHPWID